MASSSSSELSSSIAYTITGTVKDDKDFSLAKLLVVAFDKDLRSEAILSRCLTDREGKYLIPYEYKHFSREEKDSADLIIKVYDGRRIANAEELIKKREIAATTDQEVIYITKNILFNAAEETALDLKIEGTACKGLSEFER